MVNETGEHNIDKNKIAAAIETLKSGGKDINPFTLADELKVPPSAIYGVKDFVDLIIKERGSPVLVDVPLMEQLEQKVRELEQRVRQLQIQNEVLTMQQQQQYDIGHKLGVIEGRKQAAQEFAQSAGQSAPVEAATAAAPAATTTGQSAPVAAPAATTTGQSAPVEAPSATTTGQSAPVEAPAEPLPAATAPPAATPSPSDVQTAAQDVVADLAGEQGAWEGTDAKPVEVVWDTPAPAEPAAESSQESEPSEEEEEGSWETPEVEEAPAWVEPAAVAQQEAVPVAAAAVKEAATAVADLTPQSFSESYSERVYNAARGGPFVASEFNPLIELSWKDLETVYHFRAQGLRDKSMSIGQPQEPPAAKAPAERPQGGANGSDGPGDGGRRTDTADLSSYARERQMTEEPLTVLPETAPAPEVAQEAAAQTAEPASSTPDTGEMPAFAESARTINETASEEQYQSRTEASPAQEPQVEPPPFVEPAPQAEPPPFVEPAPQGEPFDSAPPRQEQEEAVPAEEEYEEQPEEEWEDDGGFDLESEDIFEGFDDYSNLQDIEILKDVELGPEGKPANDDELRDLIKNRIKQAREAIPDTPREAISQGVGEGEAAKGIRSKFVGSKAQAGKTGAEGAAPGPGAGAGAAPAGGGFVSRNIPPEIRKACLILGVRPEEMTSQSVYDAWKKQIASPGVHPDLGGDHESAIYLNTAKDTLLRWLETSGPKLGKKFGSGRPGGGKPAPGEKSGLGKALGPKDKGAQPEGGNPKA